MITVIKNTNIFDIHADYLIIPVNIVGIMGAGLAKEFKQRFPEYFKDYRKLCNDNQIIMGRPYLHPKEYKINTKFISFPTKNHYSDNSEKQWITMGLVSIFNNLSKIDKREQITIALPPLGCGLGGLKIDEIYQIIESLFKDSEVYNVYFLDFNNELNL